MGSNSENIFGKAFSIGIIGTTPHWMSATISIFQDAPSEIQASYPT